MVFQERETKRFSDSVAPGDSVELTADMDYPATIEQVDVRFYRGPELAVEVMPFRHRNGDRRGLVEMFGTPYIVGDGDHWTFDVAVDVTEDDEIGVEINNTATVPDSNPDLDLEYTVICDITLEQAGGASRLIDTVMGVFS